MTEPLEPVDPAVPDPEAAPSETEPGPPAEPAADADAPRVPAVFYELPGARTVVASGFGLVVAAAGDLRRAGLYTGLLFLGTLGPIALAVFPILDRLGAAVAAGRPPEMGPEAGLVGIVVMLGVLGFMAATVDASIVAVALLAGRASGRPLSLREAVGRARQTFWSVAGATILISIVGSIAAMVVQVALETTLGGADQEMLPTVVRAVATVPWVYAPCGVVLGAVGGMTAIGRSTEMFRVRPGLAAVVAAFGLVAQLLTVFGMGAAADELGRVGLFLHLDQAEAGAGIALGGAVVVVALVALGSLQLSIDAIVAAPQVAAFLGLTRYDRGIDLARIDAGARPARLVSVPMLGAIAVELLLALTIVAAPR